MNEYCEGKMKREVEYFLKEYEINYRKAFLVSNNNMEMKLYLLHNESASI